MNMIDYLVKEILDAYDWGDEPLDYKESLVELDKYVSKEAVDILGKPKAILAALPDYLEEVKKKKRKGTSSGEVLQRKYKDSAFYELYNDKRAATLLISQLLNTNYSTSDVKIVTLDNYSVTKRHNDLGIQAGDDFVILCEEQSTKCANMPMRMLLYYSYTVEDYIKSNALNSKLYENNLLKFPTPRFYVVDVTGKAKDEYRLSNSYAFETGLELKVKVIKSSNCTTDSALYLYYEMVKFVEGNRSVLGFAELKERWHEVVVNSKSPEVIKQVMLEKEDTMLGSILEEVTIEDRIKAVEENTTENNIKNVISVLKKQNYENEKVRELVLQMFENKQSIAEKILRDYCK